jgi:hypothetical protein
MKTTNFVLLCILGLVLSPHAAGQTTRLDWDSFAGGSARGGKAGAVLVSLVGGGLTEALRSPDMVLTGGFLSHGIAESPVSSIAFQPGTPTEYMLLQNYPNPFNSTTTIRYGLPQESQVTLIVYNTLGQQVAELEKENIAAGFHEVRFGAANLPSGMYFYRLQTGDFVKTRKLLLLK